jgi:hypothetical protein
VIDRRIGLVDVAAAALLLLSAFAFLEELTGATRGRERDPLLFPSGWLLGGPQVEPLRHVLEGVGHRLPRGAVVAVDSQAWNHEQLHYLTMWSAYYLPRHHVIHREFLVASKPPVYVLTVPPRDVLPAGAVAIELPLLPLEPPLLSIHRLDTVSNANR